MIKPKKANLFCRSIWLIILLLLLSGCEGDSSKSSEPQKVSTPETPTGAEVLSADSLAEISDFLGQVMTEKRAELEETWDSELIKYAPGEYSFQVFQKIDGTNAGAYFVWSDTWGAPEEAEPDIVIAMGISRSGTTDTWAFNNQFLAGAEYQAGQYRVVGDGTYQIDGITAKEKQIRLMWEHMMGPLLGQSVGLRFSEAKMEYRISLQLEDFYEYNGNDRVVWADYDDGSIRNCIRYSQNHNSWGVDRFRCMNWLSEENHVGEGYERGDICMSVEGIVSRYISDTETEIVYLKDILGGAFNFFGEQQVERTGEIEGTVKGKIHLMTYKNKVSEFWICQEGELPIKLTVTVLREVYPQYEFVVDGEAEYSESAPDEALVSVDFELTTTIYEENEMR